jgi:hypothetical protein
MANSRYYSSTAQQTTLTGGITASDTTITVASTAGFPGSVPYTLAIDYGAASEELVQVSSVASLSLTVTRAIDGTSASSHSVGAVVRHVSSARDFTDSRTHEASSAGVHGVTGSVVGTTDTQTLSNKTLTRAGGSLLNPTIFNTGAVGTTTIVGDSTNPTTNRLDIKDDEVNLNSVLFVQYTGNIKMIKAAAEADNIYRLRLTDNNGTTERWYVLAGGTMSIQPTSATTFVGVDYVAPDTSTTKRAMRIAASGGGTERFTIWNDGQVNVIGTSASRVGLLVKAAASQTADIIQVQDSAGVARASVLATGGFQVTGTAASGTALASLLSGDTFDRVRILNSGQIEMGTGAAARDTNLYRSAVSTLKTDGSLVVGTNLLIVGTASDATTGVPYKPVQDGSVSFVFSGVSSVDVNVTFPVPFASAPKVTATFTSLPSNSSALIVRASSVTASGMTLRANDVGGINRTLTITADWIAAAS